LRLALDPLLIAYYALGLVVLYLAGWLLLVPFRSILRFFVNSLLGAGLFLLLRCLGFYLPLTGLYAALIGFLGIPGVLIVIVIQYLF